MQTENVERPNLADLVDDTLGRGARPRPRTRRSPRPRPGSADAITPDLESLLTSALDRLAESTRSTWASVWALQADGSLCVAASAFREGTAKQPCEEDRAALEEVWTLRGAFDLGDPAFDERLLPLSERHGFAAAAALASTDGEPLGLFLLGGPEDPPGRVRPRILAKLDAATTRLSGPATTASAITRLSRLDEQVRRLDRLATLGELLAEVVHEVRNPLVAVKSFLELLPEQQRDPACRDESEECRALALEEVQRMERLLHTVLQYGRSNPDESQVERSALGPVLKSVARLLSQRALGREVELTTDVPATLPEVAIAPDALRQIVLNLTLNALAVTRPGGSVALHAQAGVNQVVLCVDDEGAGVDPEDRERIFEPSVSTRRDQPGGLGLAISKRLAEEAGGSIAIDDAPHGGARFKLELRRA